MPFSLIIKLYIALIVLKILTTELPDNPLVIKKSLKLIASFLV